MLWVGKTFGHTCHNSLMVSRRWEIALAAVENFLDRVPARSVGGDQKFFKGSLPAVG